MQIMADKVEAMLPKDMGFAILVFPLNNPGMTNYVANARREDMIKALRECANKLEQGLDHPEAPDKNIYKNQNPK